MKLFEKYIVLYARNGLEFKSVVYAENESKAESKFKANNNWDAIYSIVREV